MKARYGDSSLFINGLFATGIFTGVIVLGRRLVGTSDKDLDERASLDGDVSYYI